MYSRFKWIILLVNVSSYHLTEVEHIIWYIFIVPLKFLMCSWIWQLVKKNKKHERKTWPLIVTIQFPASPHLHIQLLLSPVYLHKTDVLMTICHPQPSWIHVPAWLLCHLQLQSLIFDLQRSFWAHLSCLPRLLLDTGSVIQCPHPVCLPLSPPPAWPFSGEPWQSPSWGVPCLLVRVIMTVIMNVGRQKQTVGIYYGAMRMRGGTGDERNSMP